VHIFIDETGRFANPGKKDEAVSLVGALCVADTRLDELYKKFDKLKETWGFGKKEVKGVELDETQLRDTLILLRKHDVKVKMVMTDLGLYPESQVIAHREHQEDILTAHLTDQHHANLVREIKALQERVRRLSPPLWVICKRSKGWSSGNRFRSKVKGLLQRRDEGHETHLPQNSSSDMAQKATGDNGVASSSEGRDRSSQVGVPEQRSCET